MAASSADNMPTGEEAAPQSPYQGRADVSANAQAVKTRAADERKQHEPAIMARRPAAQRVRTVRLTTHVHPDMLVPYLYGEHGGRSINSIANATDCTIDYCALSPGEPERSPQSQAYVMNFLVSAGSSETLEEATIQLRKLVDRVQVHIQNKARVSRPMRGREDVDMEMDGTRQQYYEAGRGRRGMVSPRISGSETTGLDAASKRKTIQDERWANGSAVMEPEEGWDISPMQRVYYAPGGPRAPRQRPIYMEVTDVEADEKSDFVMPERRAAVESTGADALYSNQRAQSPSHFVARRRARRYPDQSRWMPRNYPVQMREAAYATYAVASPHGVNEQAQRTSRNRQPRQIYQGVPNHFAQSEYSPYEYDDADEENDADFHAYDETADLTNENAGANESSRFRDVPEQHEPVRRGRPRRNLKRRLSNMRNDGPPPPPIYRQRMPYIYDYAYDEDDEWVTEEDEMAVAYDYPPQFRPVEIPVVRRRRRFDSLNSQQWSNSAGPGHTQMYKRRRIPRDGGFSLRHDTSDDPAFEAPNRENVIPHGPRPRTARVDQLGVAENPSTDIYPGQTRDLADTAEIPTEDGSTVSSASDTHVDNAVVEGSKHDTVANENASTEGTGGKLTDSASNRESDRLAQYITLDQTNVSISGEVFQSTDDRTSQDGHPQQRMSTELNLQSEIMPLDPIEETAALVSLQRFATTTSSLTRKSPESRFACPPSPDASCNAPREMESAMVQVPPGVSEAPIRPQLPVPVPIVSEHNAQPDPRSDEAQNTQPTHEASTPVEIVVTDTIRINKHVIASLERVNKVEADFVVAKAALSVQEDKFRRLENSSKCHRRLDVLCGIVYDLQRQLGSHSSAMDDSREQYLLGMLDSYLGNLFIESEQTLQEKVDALQAGVKHFLAMDVFPFRNQAVKSKPVVASGLESVPTSYSCTTSTKAIAQDHDNNDDAVGMDWEEDGWFEESAPRDPAVTDENQANFVAQISSRKSSMKFDRDFLSIKLEEGRSSRWPRELPSFIWSLLARVISSDPPSYVMRVTHKRLMDEIAKGDPYYYLQPMVVPKEADMSSSLGPSPSQPCEFGCRGASALKWERKLVSQISSRMKSFDNVAYSLARSSGGKEVLNRKKMNSIIRKLHLVAMQLHSLVSHLYCVKGQITCREVDSLPIALNNSHFERKMGVYKSRLKLVVPNKYQQQPTQQQQSTSEPAEELLRDTYEFFPELLLCVDIWGYNYRESQAKRHNSKSLLGDQLAGSGALFPLGFFRGVESLAFDFEHDSNGLLRCICDELLNIVCLWNDFKWTDNLSTVALDRVESFETDVTASILKILELYAHHLQSLWAVRLLDEPEQLRSVHFTQFNAYYSDRSQGSLNTSIESRTSVGSQSRAPGPPKRPVGPNRDAITVDRLVANEIVEQRLAEEYWNHKVTALSSHNPDGGAMEVDGAEPTSGQLLSAETISSWDQQTMASYLLRWSDVYAIRCDVNALSAVTNHMLKHEVQKYSFLGRDCHSEAGGDNASKTAVDSATRQLLAVVSRAQMLVRDALIGAEKVAFHSAANQLPEERKRSTCDEVELEGDETSEAVESTASSSKKTGEKTLSCQATVGMRNDAQAYTHNDAASDSEHCSHDAAQSNTSNTAGSHAVGIQEEVDVDAGMTLEQPELKDLIQLLAVTKQDMQDLCGHRPRSARMREKVQTQSLQLARQAVEIFRNIRNMYGSQRR